MDILEKLYDTAQKHLAQKPAQWEDFARDFRHVLSCHMVIYIFSPRDEREIASPTPGDWTKRFTLVTSSAPDVINAYLNHDFGDTHPIAEETLVSFEPILRSEIWSDDVFLSLGEFAHYAVEIGLFHSIIAPAQLSDGSLIRLFVWRGQDEDDFTAADKQRLALFMRYLLAIVDQADLPNADVEDAVRLFGQKFSLTESEIEVLDHLLKGLTPREIAKITDRSYNTIRWHVQNILEKCQVTSQKGLLHEFYALIHR